VPARFSEVLRESVGSGGIIARNTASPARRAALRVRAAADAKLAHRGPSPPSPSRRGGLGEFAFEARVLLVVGDE